ncbi:hypothetical protein J7T55_002089 [Diaporthe amygdali]|uniref:uncharacterized protein n=1 Tax=Phomopsis amygdali TaxID=1214568 RepID=UPI0022FF1168|nr:uncharacterized protein J7T55_002089 [Diaporthe amygdali]KAJ0108485.1 hypothetical protein J7T55_002089 [Diaporthe amygdali]
MAESQHDNSSSVNVKPRVFRVRNLPAHVDRLSAVELLCQSINGITAQDVRLSSLAYDVDVWSWLRTKTATITLRMIPPVLTSILNDGECTIAVPGLAKPLIIDHHFQGITPLNHVPDDEHKYEDELPQRLPGVRFLSYGYDTSLCDSTSFQLIPDLAISLVQTVKAIGCSAPSAKPLLFLAHSLGGVVLKQALIILAGGGNQERSVLAKIKGAIFFGVPSQGMSIPDIFEMLGDQPNVALVKDLSNLSDFLPRLDEQFGNISYLQRLQFFWAFETKVTPIVEKALKTGKFSRTGPGTVMVSRESATRNLCHSQPSLTIQIDENHSNMVKLGIGDRYIGILASKLKSICALCELTFPQLAPQSIRKLTQSELADPKASSNPPENIGKTKVQRRSDLQPEWMMPEFWNGNEILSSLRAPERDRRLEQINEKLGDTFNWAYDDSSVGLSEWLQKGTGIFWIHGKPASGKSTLMKYLYQDSRTEELLRAGGWQSRARLMTASFFFHHRGNNMQKSFEGLLRSLVSQILEQEKTLLPLLYPILADQYQTLINSSRLDSLEADIWALLDRLKISWSSDVMREVAETVALQRELTQNRRLGMHLRRMLKDLGIKIQSRPIDPYEEAEFDDTDFILKAEVKQQPNQGTEADSQSPEPRNWLAILRRTLQRHYQQFIASFLQDLVQQPVDPSKHSSNRIRILFSSRPWKALNDEFAACPGFQIHDYTGNDIIEFCAASIPSDDTTKTFLSPFVMEIVRRARGVFLWVELVMRDLTNIVLHRAQLRDTQGLEQDLRKTLDGIPDELDDYYQVIVQRIPPGNRWESYVVLETLCRSDEDMETETLLAILKCSSARSLADAKHKLNQGSQTSLNGPGLEWGERFIKAVSGGLVEVGGLSQKGEPILQFMHQTVKQFVEGPWFKLQLLGNNIGLFITENGHSFIAKHLFTHALFKDRFIRHARKAETTMGFSQYDFFSTAPTDHYSFFTGNFSYLVPSTIAVAVFAGLQLCVRDAYEADPCCIQQNSPNLVWIVLEAATARGVGKDMDSIINMAELLVSKGLSIHETDDGLLYIVEHMWSAPRAIKPLFEKLALILVDAIQITSTAAESPSFQSMSTHSTTIRSSTSETKLLHKATPKLIRALLARGFNPNSTDGHGNTPIDFVVDSLPSRLWLREQYDIVSQLFWTGYKSLP